MLNVITLIRVYDETSPREGYRVLVDRLWPRGVTKDKLKLDSWMKEVAPSNELRKWFSHEPSKWNDFKIRYFKELDGNSSVQELIDICRRERDVVFLYSSKEKDFNNAVALKEYVMAHL